MSVASNLSQAAPTAEAQPEVKSITVSRASAKHNRVIGESELAEIIEQIRTGSGGVNFESAELTANGDVEFLVGMKG